MTVNKRAQERQEDRDERSLARQEEDYKRSLERIEDQSDFKRLEEKVDALTLEIRAHINSLLRHFGTVLGASGPLLVVIIELVRLLTRQ